jgi:hypothetical protein
MNDCTVSSQQEIQVWQGGVTFTMWLSCSLHSILIKYYTTIIVPVTGEASIDIPIQ